MIDGIWDFARGTFWGIFTQQKVPMSKTSMTNAKSSQVDIMSPHCYTRAFGDGPRNFEPWSSDVDDT
ncbi:hypothetical protein TNCV_1454041 [Trichonephila clavipes]|nr:hypothetical protein TNCV_1454041 [Trichonephila clavipes]